MEPQCDIAALIQAQVDAYNRHDAAAFVEFYTPTAVIGALNGPVEMTGRDNIRASYASMFATYPNLSVTVRHRAVLGRHVVDEEVVTLNAGEPVIIASVAYTIEGCKISRADIID
jgi:uncharacterized protein (TIGR02246 family)